MRQRTIAQHILIDKSVYDDDFTFDNFGKNIFLVCPTFNDYTVAIIDGNENILTG